MTLELKLNDIETHAQCPIRDIASTQVCSNGVKAIENANRF